jgi:phosphoribosyl-ATP pyrophosphohydrolase
MGGKLNFLHQLESIIAQRAADNVPGSYVSQVMQQGLDRLLKKIGEEAGEVIIAAKNGDKDELLHESADLIFHLMLVLQHQGVSLNDVVAVLTDRHHK